MLVPDDGGKALNNSGIRKGEIARLREAKVLERKRVKYDRFRIVMAIMLVVVVAFASAAFGVAMSNYSRVSHVETRNSVEYRLSLVFAALLAETTASINFCGDYGGSTTVSEWEKITYIKGYQAATLKAIEDATTDEGDCEYCGQVLSLLNMEFLFFIQESVLRRSLSPRECLRYFMAVFTNGTEAFSYFLGKTLQDNVVALVWYQPLLLSMQSITEVLPGSATGTLSQELLLEMYDYLSSSLAVLTHVNGYANALGKAFPKLLKEYRAAVEPTFAATTKTIEEITVDLTGVTVNQRYITADAGLELIYTIYSSLLADVGARKSWRRDSSVNYVILFCSGFSIGIAIIVIVVSVASAMSIIWVSSETLYAKRHQEQLECSLERMEYFVDRMLDLDIDGVLLATMASSQSKAVTTAERELFRMSQKVLQVLAYINPQVYTLRKCSATVGKTVTAGGNDEDPDIQLVLSSEEIQEAKDAKDAKPSSPTSAGPASNPSAESQASNPFLEETTVWRQAVLIRNVCFLLVDISCFFEEVTPETAKVLPQEITNFMTALIALSKECGGIYITTSGTKAIIVFIEETLQDPENVCVSMLVAMQQKILPSFPRIRCAVVSSSVPSTIVGTPSMKSFITDGDVLYMGDLLIRTAHLHGAVFVADTLTFMKLDTQFFHMVALEQVGYDEEDLRNTTTVYELVQQGANKSTHLWNEAFDQFYAGEYVQANDKLRLWKKMHGVTKSWLRFHSLLNAKPQPRPITFLFASRDNYEAAFLSA